MKKTASLFMLSAATLLLTLGGCRGYVDPATLNPGGQEEPTPTPKPDPEELPVGELRIYADKTSITADGNDAVTFTVLYGTAEGNKDVSEAKTMNLIHNYNGVEKELGKGIHTFTTATEGSHTFKAYYYYGGDNYSTNEVTVEAKAAQTSGVKYYQKLFGMQFTSTGCQNCPELSNIIKRIQADEPGRLVNASFHMNYNNTDPMTIAMSNTYFTNYFKDSGLPAYYLNLRPTKYLAFQATIQNGMEEELNNYPATCGVAIETQYDAATRKLEITAKITSATASVYRYDVTLVEDGIIAEQLGLSGSAGTNYEHNNVVRAVLSNNVSGTRVNEGNPLEPGVEVTMSRTTTLNEAWNAEKMRVIVTALASADGGTTYVVNNCNECVVGGSAAYLYADEDPNTGTNPVKPASDFQRQILAMEFTGTWCSWCPKGLQNITKAIEKSAHPERVHLLALHSDSSGDDPMAHELATTIGTDFDLSGYPFYVLDLRSDYTGVTSDTGYISLRDQLNEIFEVPTPCGVAVESSCNGTSGEVTVKVKAAEGDTYRVAVYVVENNLVYPQVNGSATISEYNHNHVLRQLLSSSYKGDRLEVAADEEKQKSYSFTLTEEVADECMIYAVVMDSTGVVSNMNTCPLNGSSDYLLAE